MKSFIEEFKAFAVKGNVVDLAVAVVIGTAFGKIVSSLVADIIMPAIGVVLGGIDFSGKQLQIGESVITYGVFIQSVIDFLIVALVIFLAVKALTHLKQPEEEIVKDEPISEEVLLLREIRDELRSR